MARKNPIGRIAHTAINSIKDPFGTAEKVVEQAKGTAALGKMVAEQVGRSAASLAGARLKQRPDTKAGTAESPTTLRSVPPVNEAGHTVAPDESPGPVKTTPTKQAAPLKDQGDKLAQAPTGTAKKAAPRKATTKEATPKKKAASATKSPSRKAPSRKAPSKKAATPADVAKAVKKQPAKKAPTKKSTPSGKLPPRAEKKPE